MMPSFKKSPPELVARFDEIAAQVPGATRKQMFGYPVCVVSGNMFMGLHDDYLFLRLAAPDRAILFDQHGARVFAPMPGRLMTEYVVVPAEIMDGPTIDEWVQRSFGYAQNLPPKTPNKLKTPKKG
jgi:TfoX/Sxy family transcriptional regulator of competence genes